MLSFMFLFEEQFFENVLYDWNKTFSRVSTRLGSK